MRFIAAIIGTFLTLDAAGAIGVNCSSVVMQKGSICQYLSVSGTITPCILQFSSDDGVHWTLTNLGTTGVWNQHNNVPNDQNQLKNGSFAVISCQSPF
jgi:hypothetical protein